MLKIMYIQSNAFQLTWARFRCSLGFSRQAPVPAGRAHASRPSPGPHNSAQLRPHRGTQSKAASTHKATTQTSSPPLAPAMSRFLRPAALAAAAAGGIFSAVSWSPSSRLATVHTRVLALANSS